MATDQPTRFARLGAAIKREAWIALAIVGFGLLLLPAFVYIVGDMTLGAYADDGGIRDFYVNLYKALIQGNGAAWLLVVGPYLLILLVRLLWVPLARKPAKSSS